ncbi:MAG: hypothetical protein DRN53_06785 [Thermoprotei archaeon]|nr:MAG: hypothetical protein DRN53_06785 [Thermoprotei archaeon]
MLAVEMSKAIKDFEWLNAHYSELQKAYPNMYVAVKDGKVVAYGKDFGKVYDEAKEKVGEGFIVGYILSGEPFVLKADL